MPHVHLWQCFPPKSTHTLFCNLSTTFQSYTIHTLTGVMVHHSPAVHRISVVHPLPPCLRLPAQLSNDWHWGEVRCVCLGGGREIHVSVFFGVQFTDCSVYIYSLIAVLEALHLYTVHVQPLTTTLLCQSYIPILLMPHCYNTCIYSGVSPLVNTRCSFPLTTASVYPVLKHSKHSSSASRSSPICQTFWCNP